MEAIFSVFGGLPLILALALFVGVVILVRILLSPDGAFERRTTHDRRQIPSMPPTPFYDSERVLVTHDRRSSVDRRKRRFVIMSAQRGS